MKKLLKALGITITLTAIGVGVRARVKQSHGSINDSDVINLPIKIITSLR